jgi:hypothetical protein
MEGQPPKPGGGQNYQKRCRQARSLPAALISGLGAGSFNPCKQGAKQGMIFVK